MGTIQIDGSTPKLTIGNATAEDATILFDGNAQDFYIALDDSADDLLIGLGSTVGTTPAIAIDENLKVNIPVTTASTSASTGSLTTGGGAGIGADLYVGDDVYLITDSAVLGFGADKDTTLTHTDGTGLTLNSTNKLCFNDVSQFVQGISATVLGLGATDEIDLTATAVDLNGTLDVSGTSQFNSAVTLAGTTPTLTIGDAGAEDSKIVFDGNAQDFHIGLDDTDDSLKIGLGSALGTTAQLQFSTDGNIDLPNDDVGFSFGASQDLWFGGYAGEEGLQINRGGAQVANPLGSGGGGGAAFVFYNPGTSAAAEVQAIAGEGKSASMVIKQDQHDNPADVWWFGQQGTDFADNTSLFWTDYDASSADAEMSLTQAGILTTEGAMNASTTVDYAEYFEWKTELANDDKITETYGLSVVLDNGKVRLAEAGEEAKVLGVVRPNNVSAMVGGSHEFRYKDRYEKNVWGEPVREEYTLVTWNETRTKYWKDGDNLPEGKSVGDVRGTYVHGHVYPKDRIPAKVLKPEHELNISEYNWRTLASNLTSEDLVVPSTDDEKSAANYIERSTYKRDKGDGHKKGDKLTRKKINSSYDSTKTYIPRNKRRKEWCIVGLIGQVEVRDTAIIPTHWTKLKNLETGIDMYYVFNK